MSRAKFDEIKRLLASLEAEWEFKQRTKRKKPVPIKGSRVKPQGFLDIDVSNGLLPLVGER